MSTVTLNLKLFYYYLQMLESTVYLVMTSLDRKRAENSREEKEEYDWKTKTTTTKKQ